MLSRLVDIHKRSDYTEFKPNISKIGENVADFGGRMGKPKEAKG
jgi:hypothetical protein